MKVTSYRNSVHSNCSNHISSSIVMLLFWAQQMTSAVFIIHLHWLVVHLHFTSLCHWIYFFFDMACIQKLSDGNFLSGLIHVLFFSKTCTGAFLPLYIASMGLVFRLCPFIWEMISRIYIFLRSSARENYSAFIFFPVLRRAWAEKPGKMTSRPGIPRRSTCLVENHVSLVPCPDITTTEMCLWWGSVDDLCHGINTPGKHWVKTGAPYPAGPPCFLFQIAFQSFWVVSACIIARFWLVSLLLGVKSSSTNGSVPAADLHLLCWLLSVTLKLLRALSLLFSIITYFKRSVTFGNTSLYNRMQKKYFW